MLSTTVELERKDCIAVEFPVGPVTGATMVVVGAALDPNAASTQNKIG